MATQKDNLSRHIFSPGTARRERPKLCLAFSRVRDTNIAPISRVPSLAVADQRRHAPPPSGRRSLTYREATKLLLESPQIHFT